MKNKFETMFKREKIVCHCFSHYKNGEFNSYWVWTPSHGSFGFLWDEKREKNDLVILTRNNYDLEGGWYDVIVAAEDVEVREYNGN